MKILEIRPIEIKVTRSDVVVGIVDVVVEIRTGLFWLLKRRRIWRATNTGILWRWSHVSSGYAHELTKIINGHETTLEKGENVFPQPKPFEETNANRRPPLK